MRKVLITGCVAVVVCLVAAAVVDQVLPTAPSLKGGPISGHGGFIGGGGGTSGGGAGTITGVTAGTGLSGGGTSGTVTLNASNALTNATLSANTVTKATGAAALANSGITDDGTTVSTAETTSFSNGTTIANGLTTDGTIATVIQPTSITGVVNDYNPTGWFTGSKPTATFLFITASGAVTLNGLVGGISGRHVCIYNTGANSITFANEAAGSTAANRFLTVDALSWILFNSFLEHACFVYDGVASRWRQIGTVHVPLINNAGTTQLTGGVTISAKVLFNGATGHLATTGTAPTLTTCGTSPTITGSDIAGILTTGSAATTCTITFAATYTNEPVCMVEAIGITTQPTYTVSATAITMTVDTASQKYYYFCMGQI